MNEERTRDERYKQWLADCALLETKGFHAVGGWEGHRFKRQGLIYDLSAADLSQIDRIVANGLFVVAEGHYEQKHNC